LILLGYHLENTKKPYIIVANIPYYLTGYIIRKFLESQNQPIAMIVMVQKEVAQKIVAKPPSMNRLALLCQIYSNPRIFSLNW
jgi:16S rRNA (adenine1518-N6/adenine1519-N6)-dimethyltransferase